MALGYRELIPYMEGKVSLEEAVQAIKTDTRHFAKRQLTWFRREEDVIYVDKQGKDSGQLLNQILEIWTNQME